MSLILREQGLDMPGYHFGNWAVSDTASHVSAQKDGPLTKVNDK